MGNNEMRLSGRVELDTEYSVQMYTCSPTGAGCWASEWQGRDSHNNGEVRDR